MKPMLVIRCILRALVMLAVLMGPVSVNAATAAMDSSRPMTGMAMEMAAQEPDGEAMADMPCCPDEDKTTVPDCMKSCPLALLCSTVIVGSLSAASGLPLIHPLTMSFPRVAAEEPASALVDPPPRPPRA
ncbi:MAG: hypothetical protein DI546_01405 [Rhizobium sp.]|nr:MAG: hypothetical protein DI546_01405 [Rhizobium sp.]